MRTMVTFGIKWFHVQIFFFKKTATTLIEEGKAHRFGSWFLKTWKAVKNAHLFQGTCVSFISFSYRPSLMESPV